jgi:hypothetical protein
LDAVKATGDAGLIVVIVDNILNTQTNDAVFNSSLNFLVTVAEDEVGHKYLGAAPDFPKALNHILLHTTSPEVTESALELIRNIAEDADLTLALAKGDLCTTLVKHILGRSDFFVFLRILLGEVFRMRWTSDIKPCLGLRLRHFGTCFIIS